MLAEVEPSLREMGRIHEASRAGRPQMEAGGRRFALTLGRTLETVLLASHAQWALDRGDPRPAAAARRLATNGIDQITLADAEDARLLAGERIVAHETAADVEPAEAAAR